MKQKFGTCLRISCSDKLVPPQQKQLFTVIGPDGFAAGKKSFMLNVLRAFFVIHIGWQELYFTKFKHIFTFCTRWWPWPPPPGGRGRRGDLENNKKRRKNPFLPLRIPPLPIGKAIFKPASLRKNTGLLSPNKLFPVSILTVVD